jgi:predicted Zn-dependent protease
MIAVRTPSKVPPARPASRVVAAATAAALVLTGGPATVPARAQTGANAGIPMIRDAEIEQLMRDYTAPILKVAGLGNQNVKVVLIDDDSFNAFVMDAHRIFVNTGALKQSTTPNQMIGVFSHETGHIVGGHLSKMRQELANMQTAMIIGMLLGAAAIAAGHGNTGLGNAGAAVFTAPQAMAMNSLLSYQRAQEESADRAGVRFLMMTGQSAKGMYDTFKKFADDSLFAAHGANPYAQNHPMPVERMDALATLVHNQYWDKKDPPELQFRHDMMRAKLWGFTERPNVVLAHYPMSDTSLPARYARAIAAYRFAGLQVSLPQIDGLIAAMPNNPYFYELKGQALLEGARPADAIAPLRRAVQLAPDPALIQILLSQAMVATNDPKMAEQAIPLLRDALLKEPEAADAYTTLAMAYGRKNDLADADLASAQAAFARGDNKTARELADRAKLRFPVGSPGWVRADDIVAYNKNQRSNPLFRFQVNTSSEPPQNTGQPQ